MRELDCEESWVPKNWCFWTVVMEKTQSFLDCKEIQPVHSKGDQPWVFLGRNDAKAETPVRWPPHAKSWLIGKDSNAGKDWGQEEKGMTEDAMAGWHHRLDGREFEWIFREMVMDREAWRAAIHGVAKSWIWLSDWTELNRICCRTYLYTHLITLTVFQIHLNMYESYICMNVLVAQLFQLLAIPWTEAFHPRLWDSPCKNTGVGSHALLQNIFLPRDQTQVSKIADRLLTIWATRGTSTYMYMHE